MTDEATLLKYRGRAKASMTRIETFLNSKDVFNTTELNIRLENLETAFRDFNNYDAQLPEERSEIEIYEETYYELKSRIMENIASITANSTNESTLQTTLLNVSDQQNFIAQQLANITSRNPPDFNLPRLTIPTFSGNFNDWISFKDLYCATVHNNEQLKPIQKFHYLKGLLSEGPAALIKHIPFTEASYEQAWCKLVSRYDNKRQIVSSLINTFLELPKVQQVNQKVLRKLSDTADEVVRGLQALGGEASSRDPWLIHLLLDKVDSETQQQWAQSKTENDFPTFENFIAFLNLRCYSLESVNFNVHKEAKFSKPSTSVNAKQMNFKVTKCAKCMGNHFLYKCVKFKELDVAARRNFVQKRYLCYNCLSDQHVLRNCPSTHLCTRCKQRHHSMLCESLQANFASSPESPQNETNHSLPTSGRDSNQPPSTEMVSNLGRSPGNVVLLPTAIVKIKDCSGMLQDARILLDSGSEGSFISESCVQRLGLKRKHANFKVLGLSAVNAGTTRGKVCIEISSTYEQNELFTVEAYILSKLTASLPSSIINVGDLNHLKTLHLADPTFCISSQIDVILGADHMFSLLLPGQISSPDKDIPVAQNTKLGWIVSGKTVSNGHTTPISVSLSVIHSSNVEDDLKRFWETEEIPSNDKILTEEEKFCEEHFKKTYSIDPSGRFVVELPFIHSEMRLGNSKPAAVSRLLSMERKFKLDPSLELKYKEFLKEYIDLGHMSISDDNCNQIDETPKFYLPHHSVNKESSTTSCRVVFDASCKSSSNYSLNSCLGVGPKLQQDIFNILLNFRCHKIAVTSDIEKMYRQILVAPKHRTFQRILWRFNDSDAVEEYKLNTVTYGLSPSSFLATRCLTQIAQDCAEENPEISRIIQDAFYIDDCLLGADNLDAAISNCKLLSSLLKDYGFNLRKYSSNSQELLRSLKLETFKSNIEIQPTDSSKVLGLHWDTGTDNFFFKTELQIEYPLTKRKVLSNSARVYDPLGLLSVCTIIIKIFYQRLWLTNLDWDSVLPDHLTAEWFQFQEQFQAIKTIRIPRWVLNVSADDIQLHGFADASTLAFSAVIYVRQTTADKVETNLLVSKSRVAPIKQLSIPRLELCGAHLLARLFKCILPSIPVKNIKIFAWSDSKVVLSWLAGHPSKWKTFVGNRTSKILNVLPNKVWNYIPSKQNPADIASRGINPKELLYYDRWFLGPSWLSDDEANWPATKIDPEFHNQDVTLEQKSSIQCAHALSTNETFSSLFDHYSSLSKIVRILAYVQRFVVKCKNATSNNKAQNHVNIPLKLHEIDSSLKKLILWVQKSHYNEELNAIKNGQPLKCKSALLSLNPFIDNEGVLRVGGRLSNSEISLCSKHPIILPGGHKISYLLIHQFHITHLHAGATLLSNLLRQNYWIIGCKRILRKYIHRCLVCCRYRATTRNQLMGDLPKARVTLERPFTNCGIDYAGFFVIKFNKGRGAKTTKAYIALFICLATKAIHLECVGGLDADSFIAALRRFSSRRGAPKRIFSDNGSNFVGAKRKLSELQRLTSSIHKTEAVSYELNSKSIEWEFIPPHSAHFGGIWESGIKSVKYHLKRTMTSTLMTFEEFTTVLTQIEGILNSRPLTAATDASPETLNVITPSHFLTGDVLTSIPDAPDQPSQIHIGNRWEAVQRLRRCFWKAWHRDYLNSLQQRTKWKRSSPNLQVGDLVIVKEDNLPPATWPLGYIVEIYPGHDGHVRVATIKTSKGLYKRSIHRLVLIPA